MVWIQISVYYVLKEWVGVEIYYRNVDVKMGSMMMVLVKIVSLVRYNFVGCVTKMGNVLNVKIDI